MTLLIWQFANASLGTPSAITWQRPHESLRKPATGRSWPVWWNSREPPRLCTSGVSMIFHWQKHMAWLSARCLAASVWWGIFSMTDDVPSHLVQGSSCADYATTRELFPHGRNTWRVTKYRRLLPTRATKVKANPRSQ